jgi:hypothetical protein
VPGAFARRQQLAFPDHVHEFDTGSVSARASKYSWLDEGRDFSRGFQHTQNRCGAAKEVKSAVVGGHLLIGPGCGNGESYVTRRRRDRIRQPIVGT